MANILILIDNGHGEKTDGKCSPDRAVLEYKWARQFASRLERALTNAGINCMRFVTEERDVSLTERVRRVNAWCDKRGASNVLLISIHCNAAANDGKWHNANGFSVYVSKNSSAASKKLATTFTDLAKARGLTKGRSIPACKYWTWPVTQKSDIYILKASHCPAVLTENMFMDNHEDVRFLLSEEGQEALCKLHVDAVLKYLSVLQ